ncbi:MAG: thioredoxin domain-containing protein [Oligoflexales bacterium]|nr:thioredoxin domain-containing protein [Oligoflexales bacterium]
MFVGCFGVFGLACFLYSSILMARNYNSAYKIGNENISYEKLYNQNKEKLFEIEKKKYELIEKIAKEKYLEYYWREMGKEKKISVEKAKSDYLANQNKYSEKDVSELYDRYRNHPKLRDLSDDDKRKQIVEYLQMQRNSEVFDKIIEDAIKSGGFSVLYPKPEEPRYDYEIFETDSIRYGPDTRDTKPLGCSYDCKVTVIEYSEFQCPFCERIVQIEKRLLKEYKGKLRWLVRDFPLSFHDRALAAAVAAKCAAIQDRYWEMYELLFANQRSLSNESLTAYGKTLGLDFSKYESCIANPDRQLAVIEKNQKSGEKMGINGTPAFIINGRKVSGVLPYEEFKKIIDEELANKKNLKI